MDVVNAFQESAEFGSARKNHFLAKMMKDLLLSGKKIQEIYSEFSVVTFSSKLDDQVEEAATTRRTP